MSKKGYIDQFMEEYKPALKLPDQVKIFDTTLRDGEQTPGVSFTPEQKVRIANELDEINVDVIEAGFPMVSEGEEESVKKIAEEDLDAEVCGLCRATEEDIEKAIECGVDSIHTFIATSDIHLEKKLELTREERIRWSLS